MTRRPILQEYERSESPAGYVTFYQPCSVRPAHFHGQLELLVVTRGHFSCLVGSETHVVQAPALVWHLPTIGHQMLEASSDCFFWVIMFEPFFAQRVLSAPERGGEVSSSTRFSLAPRLERVADAQSPFASWILGLTNLVGRRPIVEIPRATADTMNELGVLATHAQTPAQLTHRLGQILQLAVDESERQLSHLASSPSLSELGIALLLAAPELERDVACRELAVSASYLARQFQRQAGATFADFRNRARVVSFLAAAAKRTTSLLEAALASGFGTYTQAHRVFSNLTGYCPTCYLQSGGRSKLSELTIDSRPTA